MAYAIVAILGLAMVIGWWVSWWGSETFEVKGVAARIERAIDKRWGSREEDGIAMTVAKGTFAALLTTVIVWGGFVMPLVVLVVIAMIFG